MYSLSISSNTPSINIYQLISLDVSTFWPLYIYILFNDIILENQCGIYRPIIYVRVNGIFIRDEKSYILYYGYAVKLAHQ